MDTMHPDMAEAMRKEAEQREREIWEQIAQKEAREDAWRFDRALELQTRELVAQGVFND